MHSRVWQDLAESWPEMTRRWLDSLPKVPLPAAEIERQVAANVRLTTFKATVESAARQKAWRAK